MPLGEHPVTLQLWDERFNVFTSCMDSMEAATVLRISYWRVKDQAVAGKILRHEIGERRVRYCAPELAGWLFQRWGKVKGAPWRRRPSRP